MLTVLTIWAGCGHRGPRWRKEHTVRKRTLLPLLSVGAVLASLLVASPASAHGYVNSPLSRQAQCAQTKAAWCGQIMWEPQSAEGPKGLRNCHGSRSDLAVLSDDSKPWRVHSVGTSLTLTWTFTAKHRTQDYEYYIGGTRVGHFANDGAHTINLSRFSGRQKLLAIWNIGDTANAFYSCIDLQIGGGGNNPPPPPAGGTWAPNTTYSVGSVVTYGGSTYRCIQSHTSLPGWEPPNVPVLWQRA